MIFLIKQAVRTILVLPIAWTVMIMLMAVGVLTAFVVKMLQAVGKAEHRLRMALSTAIGYEVG